MNRHSIVADTLEIVRENQGRCELKIPGDPTDPWNLAIAKLLIAMYLLQKESNLDPGHQKFTITVKNKDGGILLVTEQPIDPSAAYAFLEKYKKLLFRGDHINTLEVKFPDGPTKKIYMIDAGDGVRDLGVVMEYLQLMAAGHGFGEDKVILSGSEGNEKVSIQGNVYERIRDAELGIEKRQLAPQPAPGSVLKSPTVHHAWQQADARHLTN